MLVHMAHDSSSLPKDMLYRLLKGCTVTKHVGLGRRVHALIASCGYELDMFLANHLIRMYTSHGNLQEAKQVFQKLPVRDTFVWASIISAHSEHGAHAEAIKLYEEMRCSSVKPNDYIFVAVLKACATASDLASGKHVHSHVIRARLESNVFVASSLVDMYTKCNSLEEARTVFDRLAAKNVVTYSAIIAGYAQHGFGEEALKLYEDMQQIGLAPDKVTYCCLLKACGVLGSMHAGKKIHAEILLAGLESDTSVGNSLVNMYVKCNSLRDAQTIFDRLPKRDVMTWNVMIAGYCQHGFGQEAMKLYRQMDEDVTIRPSTITYSSILKLCGSQGDLQEGKRVHAQVLESGVEADVYVGSALVDMYAKCGCLEDAQRVLDRNCTTDVVVWNAMVSGFAKQGLSQDTIRLYSRMQQIGIVPDTATFLIVLKACGDLGAVQEGSHIHAQILERGLITDVSLGNTLIDMYARCGSLLEARQIFDNMPIKSVVTWNAMIGGYVQAKLQLESFQLFESMQRDGVAPTATTYVSLLKACSTAGCVQEGARIHAEMKERGLEEDVFIGSALVDMFAKCRRLDDARQVFDRLPTRNVVVWNAMIGGYAKNGFAQEALELYSSLRKDTSVKSNSITLAIMLQLCGDNRFLQDGKRIHAHVLESGLQGDSFVGSTLIDMYAKFGDLSEARKIFDGLCDKDVVVWTSMISSYVQHNQGQQAVHIYRSMEQASVAPNAATFVSILKACGGTGAVQEGKRIHEQVVERGLDAEICVKNALVDMYGKCGSMGDAQKVFDNMTERDVVSWSALIYGYGNCNDCDKAIQFFQKMVKEGVVPNEATFTALLVACCHVGYVREGQRYFDLMAEYGIKATLEHHTCMVDLLGRAGHLAEAEHVVRTVSWGGDTVGWMALLNACKSHGDMERGQRCFDHLVKVEPKEAGAYVLMSHIYAYAGRWEDVDKIGAMRMSAGAFKKPAKAVIEVKNEVHKFTVGEKHADVSCKVGRLHAQLKREGHVPHTALVLTRMPEKVKEDMLCGHAEKLAIAFGLLHTEAGTKLVVTKNLRMCSDCHSGTKIVSKIEKREIVVRDAHRVHHFQNGVCSCRDHH